MKFSDKEQKQIEAHGLTTEQVEQQVKLLKKGTVYIELIKSCTIGEGIFRFTSREHDSFVNEFEDAVKKGRVCKFTPASGAATRMFKSLHKIASLAEVIPYTKLKEMVEEGNKEAQFTLKFINNIEAFAFTPQLRPQLSASGQRLGEAIHTDVRTVLKYLLYEDGLNYAVTPKGLIPFHQDGKNIFTPFAEQVYEALEYACDDKMVVRTHFTVPDKKRIVIEEHLKEIQDKLDGDYKFEMTLSLQENSTDTVALNKKGKLAKDDEGNILFRPGGHGALINNLNNLKGDIIFIKNIDNVIPYWNNQDSIKFKKVLGGLLVRAEKRVFKNLIALESKDIESRKLEEIYDFCWEILSVEPEKNWHSFSKEEKRTYLIQILDRPLRVCGMVKNQGEPGGGPFWIKNKVGHSALQIVEGSQINKNDPKQLKIFETATHFNPVDIVCSVRNYKGKQFDLELLVDKETSFIAEKSNNGDSLLTVELPGLWNGAMSGWNSIFVEVPASTFNPVKTVNDLLRPEHR